MQFKTLNDFLHMGGYAMYVWPAYIIVFLFIMINLINNLQQHKKILKQLRDQHETPT